MGFFLATRFASLANFLGFPKDSRWSRITSVSSSLSQYWIMSLLEMSALFPTEMKLDIPSPSLLTWSIIAYPRAPD